MLVNYTNANIHTIPIGSYDAPKNIILKPGINEVEEADWELALKKCPDVKKMVDEGVIVLKSQKSAHDDLSKFNQKEALEIVKGTFAVDLLTKWIGAESRPAVRSAINAQVSMIKAPAKDEKDKDKKDE